MLQTPSSLKIIDTSQFDYRHLNSHQNLKSVGLYYKNLKLVLNTGLVETLSKIYQFNTSKENKYYLLIDTTRDIRNNSVFIQNCINIDNQLLQDGVHYAHEWFGEYHPLAVLERKYSPVIQKPNRNFPFPDLIKDKDHSTFRYTKIRIPVNKDGTIDCCLYDKTNTRINLNITDLENILEQYRENIKMIIQCDGLWFAGGKYGCNWRLLSLTWDITGENILKIRGVQSYPCIKTGLNFNQYSFLSDSDEE